MCSLSLLWFFLMMILFNNNLFCIYKFSIFCSVFKFSLFVFYIYGFMSEVE